MISAMKDAMTAKAAQVYVNGRIGRYGKLTGLKIDSRNKTMELVGQLQGEAEPVTVLVERYAIHEIGEKRFVEIKECSCSRPWLANLLNDFALGRRVELPGWAASAL
jgi:hypothetical protein